MPQTPQKFEDWTPPWAEGEFDADRAAKLIHSLKVDKETLQERVNETASERDQYKNSLDEKSREGESEVDRLKRELADRDTRLAEAGKTSLETMKLRAALKVGLRAEHVNRLVGETEEELEADAKVLLDSFGGQAKQDDENPPPRTRPRPRRTPGDPAPENGDDLTVEQMLAAVPRNAF